jgi:DNA-binding beta-propeller fold protein YncE
VTRTFNKLWVVTVFLLFAGLSQASAAPHLAYIGTLDHKLLIIDEDQDAVVGEIQLGGTPRTVALSADQKQLYIINTRMTIEIVDLATRKVTGTIDLTDEHTQARVTAVARNWFNGEGAQARFSGIAVDPNGRYLYSTLRMIRKDKNEYHLDAPKFVVIDLNSKAVAKTFDFPKEYDTGFGFRATFKVSPDGKYLYVFDDDIMIMDLSSFTIVDRIPLAKPPYPGASPYRLAAGDDPYDGATSVTSLFVSVDPIVHKGTLGLASLDMTTRKVTYTPIGADLPMIGFMVAPGKRLAYSVMYTGAAGNRTTEWWTWDLQTHRVINRAPLEARTTFSFGISGDGTKLYLYGSGSTLEIFNAQTLKSEKLLFLNKDLTTRIVTLAREPDATTATTSGGAQ